MLNNIAAQLYTVREFMKAPEDIEETFKKIKEIGFLGVQLSGVLYADSHFFKEISEKYGLKIVCTHTPFDRIVNDLDTVIEEHKTYGCDFIGLGAMPYEFRENIEGINKFTDIFNKVAEKVEKKGLKLGYHNHSFEFKKISDKRIIDILIREIPMASFILDTYWIQHGGGDVIKWMNDLSGKIHMLHLKDMAMGENGQCFAEIFEGNMNFEGILKAAKEINAIWLIVEQDICPGNPFDSLRISYQNIQKYIKENNL